MTTRFVKAAALLPVLLPDGAISDRSMNFEPFDLEAAHIYKIFGGQMHEIEAMGFTIARFEPEIQPTGLLLGSRNQGRFIRLESAAMLERREIDDLIEAAIAETDTPLPKRGKATW